MKTNGHRFLQPLTWLTLIAIAALFTFVAASCRGERGPGIQKPIVETAAPIVQDIYQKYTFTGSVHGEHEAQIGVKVPGRVTAIKTDVGKRVKAGQVLITLDSGDIAAQLSAATNSYKAAKERLAEMRAGGRPEERAQAQAALEAAKTTRDTAEANYERQKALFDAGVISQSALDLAKQQCDAAKSQYEAAKQQMAMIQKGARIEDIRMQELAVKAAADNVAALSATLAGSTVRAPFDSVVSAKYTDVGNYAAPGMPLLMLVDDSVLKITFTAPIDQADILPKAEKVNVIADGTDYPAKITKVYPVADQKSRQVSAEAHLIGLKPLTTGSFVEVRVEQLAAKGVLTTTRRSVLSVSENPYVFVIMDGKVKKKPVTLGVFNDEYIEIKSGLTTSDQVIVSGQAFVKEGQDVEARKQSAATNDSGG
jgi:multidrug efflux pump subunit AcrA (membrane-fusion protein)